jgi:hypothetical protein
VLKNLAHIVETARVWPQKFYEYHKMFSSICSIMLQEHNIKLDWSLGDPELRQLVCAGSRVSTSHLVLALGCLLLSLLPFDSACLLFCTCLIPEH